ncbi:uncharacterized protein LOC141850762 [Brevipalpus obovatus]|uniref:uncharacterized protein LOC141850762 n=1 Tax=Brevipalpus obovatus TaxID=246614 RepID=UPI003D9E68C9
MKNPEEHYLYICFIIFPWVRLSKYIIPTSINFQGIEIMIKPERAEESVDKMTPEVTQHGIVMLTMTSDGEIKSNDIINLWNWKLWLYGLLVVMSLIVLKMIFDTSKPLKTGLRRSFLWPAVEMYLLQRFPCNENRPNRIITLSLALFIFLMLAALNSLISTDLIIKEKPFTIDSLEDILDPRASRYKPMWRKSALHHTIFSKSTSPIRQKIWQRALKVGLDKCLIADDLYEFANSISSYSESPSVIFIFQGMAMMMKNQACFFPSFPKAYSRAHIGKEIIAEELIRLSYDFKNDSCKTYKRSVIDKRVRIAFEAGLSGRVNLDASMQTILKMHHKPLTKWKCMGFVDPFDTKDWQPIKLSNIDLLITIYFLSLIFCIIVLFGERIFFSTFQKKPKNTEFSHSIRWESFRSSSEDTS